MTLAFHDNLNKLSGPALDDHSFQRIVEFAYNTAGLSISSTKSAMVRTRLVRRLRALNISGFVEYCDFFLGPDGRNERVELISALTTNVSHFFREEHHFELLEKNYLSDLTSPEALSRPIRFWSAGCSNGQEPLSLAMMLHECGFLETSQDVKILATDIDPRVISFAQTSQYPERMLEGLPKSMLENYFKKLPDSEGEHNENIWKSQEKLRRLITYRQLNLLDNWPMKGKFDAIFCRNVVIYFDQETQDSLWQRFSEILRPGGLLFLGHSERVSEKFLRNFSTLGCTAYRRCA